MIYFLLQADELSLYFGKSNYLPEAARSVRQTTRFLDFSDVPLKDQKYFTDRRFGESHDLYCRAQSGTPIRTRSVGKGLKREKQMGIGKYGYYFLFLLGL